MFALVSTSGAPGVTTTALALAASWPRRVLLVEADPTGASAILAGFWRGTRDDPGMVDLVRAHRAGLLAEALLRMAIPVEGSRASVILGARSHAQAAGLARLWGPLADVLMDLAARDEDVIVDAGRLGLEGWPRPLVEQADLAVLVTRSGLPALAGARSWARTLADDVLPGHEVRLLLVGAGRPYGAAEVGRALGVPVVGEIRWDPTRAAVFSEGAERPAPRGLRRWIGGSDATARAFAASAYQRSVHSCGEAMRAVVEAEGRMLFRGLETTGEGEVRP